MNKKLVLAAVMVFGVAGFMAAHNVKAQDANAADNSAMMNAADAMNAADNAMNAADNAMMNAADNAAAMADNAAK